MKPLEGYLHGANLGHWLSQYGHRGSEEYWSTYITKKDIARMAEWGIDHVRLPVDYMFFETDDEKPMVYDESRLAYIDNTIEWCGEYGINLILDLHHAPGFVFLGGEKNDLFTNEKNRARFLAIWRMFAKRYSGIGDRLIFELLNELVWENSDSWNELWPEACEVIWKESPHRRIIVGGNHFNSASELKNLKVTPDERIIYNFHFYEPIWFTHQSAPWVDFLRDYKRQIEYPFRPADHAEFRDGAIVRAYSGYEVVDKKYLEDRLKPVDKFIEETGKTVYCGEYGVFFVAPRESAIRWLNDVSTLLKERGIGRAVWSYRGFATITSPDNKTWDEEMVKAIVM
ncbi:MAG TPA: cellulase family glycosylhydrolase [Bacillota bacterium]|nr:cellulase family glycosylhydrolase [Bacillota bacterium]